MTKFLVPKFRLSRWQLNLRQYPLVRRLRLRALPLLPLLFVVRLLSPNLNPSLLPPKLKQISPNLNPSPNLLPLHVCRLVALWLVRRLRLPAAPRPSPIPTLMTIICRRMKQRIKLLRLQWKAKKMRNLLLLRLPLVVVVPL